MTAEKAKKISISEFRNVLALIAELFPLQMETLEKEKVGLSKSKTKIGA